jgi:hypothetical protein
MNPIVKLIAYRDRKAKKMGFFELESIQAVTMGFTLIVVKIFPQILALGKWWFIALMVICGAPLRYIFWLKKSNGSG